MKLVFDLIGGKVLEPDLPSPLGGLGRNNTHVQKEKKKKERDRATVRQAQRSHSQVCHWESL